MLVACATNDGRHFINEHFGDAEYFYLYEVNEQNINLQEKIVNDVEEERMHGDPNKARNITNLLAQKGAVVVVNRAFGPNIQRIKHKVIPVIINNDTIEDGLKKVQENLQEISQILALPEEERTFIDLRKK